MVSRWKFEVRTSPVPSLFLEGGVHRVSPKSREGLSQTLEWYINTLSLHTKKDFVSHG